MVLVYLIPRRWGECPQLDHTRVGTVGFYKLEHETGLHYAPSDRSPGFSFDSGPCSKALASVALESTFKLCCPQIALLSCSKFATLCRLYVERGSMMS